MERIIDILPIIILLFLSIFFFLTGNILLIATAPLSVILILLNVYFIIDERGE